jgi:prepilin-type N-terminal cleavage/methylation domain-containing protein
MKKQAAQRGFTIIELLIATAIFSLVLVVFLTAFIKIGNMFYKGVSITNTQEIARTITDDISNDIRFSGTAPTVFPADAAGHGYFCIGQHRYQYNLGQQVGVGGTPFGLLREDIPSGACSLATPGQRPLELLGDRMQLNSINVDSCPNGLCSMSILVVFYGSDNSVLVSPSGSSPAYKAADATCSSGSLSSQYCATASYKSTISQKI